LKHFVPKNGAVARSGTLAGGHAAMARGSTAIDLHTLCIAASGENANAKESQHDYCQWATLVGCFQRDINES